MATFHPLSESAGSGVLASHYMPLPATFRFACAGRRVDAAIRSNRSGGAELVLRCLLGHVPFSAESAGARQHMRSLLRAASLLPNTTVSIDKNSAIYVRRQMVYSSSPPPSYVVAGAAAIIVSLKPLQELLDKCITEEKSR